MRSCFTAQTPVYLRPKLSGFVQLGRKNDVDLFKKNKDIWQREVRYKWYLTLVEVETAFDSFLLVN
jgi:hypothetical protein